MSRAALLAFDAPDDELVARLLAEGRMPRLAGLLSGGSAVGLGGAQGPLTGASWTTLSSGASPAQSGLGGSLSVLPGSYAVGTVEMSESAHPPFWRHVSDAGLRSTVVSLYGAETLPGLRGTQVAGWGSHDSYSRDRWSSDPPDLLDELERRFGPRTIRYATLRPRGERELRKYVAGVLEGLGQQAAALAHMARATEWDLFAGSLAEVHQAGHFLWHLDRPGHPEHDPAAPAVLRDALAEIHVRADAALGEVLDALPADACVYVTWPYTHCANHHLDSVVSPLLEQWGLAVPAPPGHRGLRPRAVAAARGAARGLLPLRARYALGRRLGRDRIVGSLALAHLDMSRTRAFPVPGDGSSGLRVNLAGREPAGCVAPADYDAVLEELATELRQVVDADTGEPVAARVERFDALFGDPPPPRLPDLCVEWRLLPRVRAVRSGGAGEHPVRRGDDRVSLHRGPGMLAACGPGVAASGSAELPEPGGELLDLAPTLLTRLGVRPPAYMHGRVLDGLAGRAERQPRV